MTRYLHAIALGLLAAGCQHSGAPRSAGEPNPDSAVPVAASKVDPDPFPAMAGSMPIAAAAAPHAKRTREEKHHLLEVQTSAFCGTCHPDIYREHQDNTHGQAFTDPEARIATNDFRVPDFCVACHTPRPTFVTGNGQNPIRRWHNLEEGNTCMTCHQKAGQDYSHFQGGAAECKSSFDPAVGTVEACGSCHRNHGTPYQWAESPLAGKANPIKLCIDCHMKPEFRPAAVGAEPKFVRPHLFPASKNEAHVRSAYEWKPEIRGNEVVVTISNVGAGHNLPTELRQRSLQSLIVVYDDAGNVVTDERGEPMTDRFVFRDPYKRPYGFKLQTNTQIPSGETREHRLPLPVASGSVEVSLFFKIYYPADDADPHLSRLLERQTLRFSGVTPQPIVKDRHPALPTPTIELPKGTDEKSIRELLAIFQFPVPEAVGKAKKRAVEIGAPAIPFLIEDLGSWDGKTWMASQDVLVKMGKASIPAVVAALEHEDLYVRIHAAEIVPLLDAREAIPKLIAMLRRPAVDDVVFAARALGRMRASEAAAELRPLLDHDDPDVVVWSAKALARIGDRESIASMKAALDDAYFPETRIDLATALGDLGDSSGIPILVDALRHRDAILRTYAAEALMRLTGHYLGYLPKGEPKERVAAADRFASWWAQSKDSFKPLPPPADVPAALVARADDLVLNVGGSDLKPLEPEYDAKAIPELAGMGEAALYSLIDGMRYAEGFVDKRRELCKLLGNTKRKEAVPMLCQALRDASIDVNLEALRALGRIAFPEALGDVLAYEQKLRTWIYNGGTHEDHSPDALYKEVALTREALGDATITAVWIELLRSSNLDVRKVAFDSIRKRAGQDFGFDPNAEPDTTDAATGRAAAWWEAQLRAQRSARN